MSHSSFSSCSSSSLFSYCLFFFTPICPRFCSLLRSPFFHSSLFLSFPFYSFLSFPPLFLFFPCSLFPFFLLLFFPIHSYLPFFILSIHSLIPFPFPCSLVISFLSVSVSRFLAFPFLFQLLPFPPLFLYSNSECKRITTQPFFCSFIPLCPGRLFLLHLTLSPSSP